MSPKSDENMNNQALGKKPYPEKTFSMWDVIKYALGWAVFSEKRRNIPWKCIHTPRFPLFFSSLGAAFYMIPIVFAGNTDIPGKEHLIPVNGFLAGFVSFFGYVCFFSFFNLFLQLCFMLDLKLFTVVADAQIQVTLGAQRVSYFSTLFQPILFFGPGLAMANICGLHIPDWVAHSAVLVAVVCCAARLLVIFQTMRAETGGCVWPGLLALIPCLDVWFIFWWLYTLYFL